MTIIKFIKPTTLTIMQPDGKEFKVYQGIGVIANVESIVTPSGHCTSGLAFPGGNLAFDVPNDSFTEIPLAQR